MNPSTAGKVFIVSFIAVDSSALFLLLVIDMCPLVSPPCAIVANAKPAAALRRFLLEFHDRNW
jgi:hypothetical protein